MVLRAFNAKSSPQLLHSAPIWIDAFDHTTEGLQSLFLRKILGLPNCVPYAAICTETGSLLLETRAWFSTFKFWLRLLFNSDQNSLTFSMLMDHHASKWLTVIQKKIISLGISLDALYLSSALAIFHSINCRLLDVQLQHLTKAARKTCSPSHLGLSQNSWLLASYFSHLTDPHLRRAFMLARFNALPSAVLFGRFRGTPYIHRRCPCSLGAIETVHHVLLDCPFYNSSRARFLEPLLHDFQDLSNSANV